MELLHSPGRSARSGTPVCLARLSDVLRRRPLCLGFASIHQTSSSQGAARRHGPRVVREGLTLRENVKAEKKEQIPDSSLNWVIPFLNVRELCLPPGRLAGRSRRWCSRALSTRRPGGEVARVEGEARRSGSDRFPVEEVSSDRPRPPTCRGTADRRVGAVRRFLRKCPPA